MSTNVFTERETLGSIYYNMANKDHIHYMFPLILTVSVIASNSLFLRLLNKGLVYLKNGRLCSLHFYSSSSNGH